MTDLMQELDQVVTPDIEARLIDLRDRESLTCWDLGRVINDLYQQVRRQNVQRTKMDCCVYVARFIDSRDRSLPSMKLYAQTSALFPGRMVGKGDDRHLLKPEDEFPLPFSHFIAAAKYGDNKLKVLKESVRLMDKHGGRTVSADALERHMEALGVFPSGHTGPDFDDDEAQEPPQEDDGPMFDEPSLFEPQSVDPDLAGLKHMAQEVAGFARRIEKRYPFWAKMAGSLSSQCARIVREIEESTVEVK